MSDPTAEWITLTIGAVFIGIWLLATGVNSIRSFFRSTSDDRIRSGRTPWWGWISLSVGLLCIDLAIRLGLIFIAAIALLFGIVQGIQVQFRVFGEYDVLERDDYPQFYEPKSATSEEIISEGQEPTESYEYQNPDDAADIALGNARFSMIFSTIFFIALFALQSWVKSKDWDWGFAGLMIYVAYTVLILGGIVGILRGIGALLRYCYLRWW